MLLTLDGSTALAAASGSRRFVGEAARNRLGEIASILPTCIAVGTLEVLLDGADRLDYQICFTAKSGGRDVLAAWFVDLDLDAIEPAWRRSLEFLRYWSTPGSLMYKNSPAAWLEFDCPLDDAMPPVPFPFFSLHPPWEDIVIPRDETWATVEAGYDRLARGELDADHKEAIRSALGALPPSGCLIHTALRPVADTHVARLILRMPLSQMPAYLERAGWSHATAAFAAFLERYCPTSRTHSVQIDVSPRGVGPRIGLEFFHEAPPRTDPHWRALFDKLVADKACTSERRAQVEDWVGVPSPDRFEWLLRGLLVKVVYQPGAPLEAKGYLPFCVNPVLDSLFSTGDGADQTVTATAVERAQTAGIS